MSNAVEKVFAMLDGFRMSDEMTYSAYSALYDEILLLDDLLKEQEPVEPDGDNCGECGYALHRINYDGPGKELRHEWFRFCPSCGRVAKWDDK